MGRPSSCCCLCGGSCNKPLAIGVLPGQTARYESPPQVNLLAGVLEFRDTWGYEELSWVYNLQTADELLDTDFLSLRNGKIDCVILGDPPNSDFGDVATADISTRIDRVYFPAPDSDDEVAIFDYLAAGGNVIVKNTFPRAFSTYGPPTTFVERSYSADKQAEMNTFLSRVGSSSEFVMEEDYAFPYPHRSYYAVLPPASCWSINPDNALGRGSKRHRTRSTWRERMRQDAYNQAGVSWDDSGGFSNVVATDLSAAPSATITEHAVFGSILPQGRLSSKLVNPNQEHWFMVVPMASGAFLTGAFSSGTHLEDSHPTGVASYKRFRRLTDGGMELNGSRYVDVLATVERLPSGGRLIVVASETPVTNFFYKSAYHMALEALMRLLSGCDNFGRNSTTLLGSA